MSPSGSASDGDPHRRDAEAVQAGHAFYTRRTLAVYDLAILGYFSRVAWRCPARRVLDHYDRHVTDNHLDVGVGTGWFLDHCRFGTPEPRIGLLDVNTACLEAARLRIARYEPEVHEGNVLEPLDIDTEPFDSVGLTYLLHCLPGTIHEKGIALGHLGALARPGTTMFGATLLHGGVERSWLARKVMARNNDHGIFSNTGDDLDGLQEILGQHLSDPVVEIIGCVALFSGTTPQRTPGHRLR